MVERGTKVKPNTQYWPPAHHVGELQCPVAVTRPTVAQLTSPIVAARWAACQVFHSLMVTYKRRYRRAQRKESQSGERSSLASKDATSTPTEPGPQTLSESSQLMSGQSSATLPTMLLPLPRRPKRLTRREEEATLIRVATRNLNPQPAQRPSLALVKGANVQGRRLVYQTGSAGFIPTRFPNCQRQTVVSVPEARLLIRLTRTSNLKKKGCKEGFLWCPWERSKP